MTSGLDQCLLLCGYMEPDEFAKTPALSPFHPKVMEFLGDVSYAIRNNNAAKAYPDVMTFAFFCRRSNLEALKKQYEDGLKNCIGRGITFHIAPSNVPIIFAYSLASGLLSGNACIVKASSKDFPQTRVVSGIFQKVLDEKHVAMKQYVHILMYPHQTTLLTDYFSKMCDVRIIWGGDESVKQIRKSPLAPLSYDFAFGDRYSLLVINAPRILAEDKLDRLARLFYNDTYLYDQNACTSPHLIYWIGIEEEISKAKKVFWEAIHAYIAGKYTVEPVMAVNKQMALCRAGIHLSGAKHEIMPDMLISRISISKLNDNLDDFRCAGGSFLEYSDTTLDALPAIVSKKYQTLSYYGFDGTALRSMVFEAGLKGIDRVVPIGSTMDFSLYWDGYDLIRMMSRTVQAI